METRINVYELAKQVIDTVWSEVREAKYFDNRNEIEGLRGKVENNEWKIGKRFDSSLMRYYNTLTVNGNTFDFPSFIYDLNDRKIHILDDKEDKIFEINIKKSVKAFGDITDGQKEHYLRDSYIYFRCKNLESTDGVDFKKELALLRAYAKVYNVSLGCDFDEEVLEELYEECLENKDRWSARINKNME